MKKSERVEGDEEGESFATARHQQDWKYEKAIKGRRTTHTHIYISAAPLGTQSWVLQQSGAAWPGFAWAPGEHGYIVVCLNVFHLPAMLCNFIDRCAAVEL
jgi:hypothetical protein